MPSIAFTISNFDIGNQFVKDVNKQSDKQLFIIDNFSICKKIRDTPHIFLNMGSFLPFYILSYIGIIVCIIGSAFDNFYLLFFGLFLLALYAFVEYFMLRLFSCFKLRKLGYKGKIKYLTKDYLIALCGGYHAPR